MALEPCEILHVESPRLFLEFFRSKILLVCPRKIVEHIKQSFDIKLRKYTGCIEYRVRILRII